MISIERKEMPGTMRAIWRPTKSVRLVKAILCVSARVSEFSQSPLLDSHSTDLRNLQVHPTSARRASFLL